MQFLPLLRLFKRFRPFNFRVVTFDVSNNRLFVRLIRALMITQIVNNRLHLRVNLLLFGLDRLAFSNVRTLKYLIRNLTNRLQNKILAIVNSL